VILNLDLQINKSIFWSIRVWLFTDDSVRRNRCLLLIFWSRTAMDMKFGSIIVLSKVQYF